MSGDVTGPRWVGGVNAPASGGGDYEALVKDARAWAEREAEELGQTSYSARTLQTLADAVESLAADKRDLLRIAQEANDDCKALIAARRAERGALVHRIDDYRAERDALRTQLEGMNVEWGTEVVDVDGRTTDRDVWDTEEDARRVARQYGDTLVRRLVSPWAAVKEGDDQ